MGMVFTLINIMLPWIGIFSALSILLMAVRNIDRPGKDFRLFANLRRKFVNLKRKGSGGGAEEPEDSETKIVKMPRYKTKTVYRGIKTVELEIPVYETRKIQVGLRGIKKELPVYEIQQIQVGYKTVTSQRINTGNGLAIEQVPRYEKHQVQIGTRTIFKTIPVYEESRIQVGTKTVTRQIPEYQTVKSRLNSMRSPD
jgi:ribosomal protein S7